MTGGSQWHYQLPPFSRSMEIPILAQFFRIEQSLWAKNWDFQFDSARSSLARCNGLPTASWSHRSHSHRQCFRVGRFRWMFRSIYSFHNLLSGQRPRSQFKKPQNCTLAYHFLQSLWVRIIHQNSWVVSIFLYIGVVDIFRLNQSAAIKILTLFCILIFELFACIIGDF